MNEDPNVSAETPETESSKLAADELNPEELEAVSGGDKHAGWIEVVSHP